MRGEERKGKVRGGGEGVEIGGDEIRWEGRGVEDKRRKIGRG